MPKADKGFSLLEVLFSLSIIMVIFTLLPSLLVSISNKQSSDPFNPFEWEVFVQQAKMEIREAEKVTISGNVVYFHVGNNQVVTYEPYQDQIRRRVNGTGHEVLLQKIAGVVFSLETNGILITITTRSGLSYSALVSPIIKLVFDS